MEEVRLTKEFFGFDPDTELRGARRRARAFRRATWARAARRLHEAWDATVRALPGAISRPRPSRSMHSTRRELPRGLGSGAAEFPPSATGMSTRDASGKVLNALAEHIPWLVGGAADLSPSTKTRLVFDVRRRFPAGGQSRRLSRPQHAFRRARARDVRGGQRHDADRPARVRLGLPDLHRLCARRDPAVLADGPAGAAHLDA